jgi:PBP1b-binding outer membrane lipoprotein LpoB
VKQLIMIAALALAGCVSTTAPTSKVRISGRPMFICVDVGVREGTQIVCKVVR